jgi:hypothetical protein
VPRLSRAALETLNNLIDQMGKEMEAGSPDVERFMAAKARIAAAVSARHPEVTEQQVYDAINPLIDARLQKSTRELKRFMRPRWLQWF